MTDRHKYLVPGDERLPVGSKQVLIALGQLQSNEPIDQHCHFCDGQISGETLGMPTSAWKLSCPCGKSNSTFRGL